MAKQNKKPVFGSRKILDLKNWNDLKDINDVASPIEELPVEDLTAIDKSNKVSPVLGVQSFTQIEANYGKEISNKILKISETEEMMDDDDEIISEKFRKHKNKVNISKDRKSEKKKGILFITEKVIVDKFYELCPKFYLKLSLTGRNQNFSFVISYLLEAMKVDYEKLYGKLLEPNEEDIIFYKLNTTKGISGDLNDLIVNKSKLFIKLSEDDYNLLFVLLNTCFKNKNSKPGKYSVNYFFFEITRFLEKNLKYFK